MTKYLHRFRLRIPLVVEIYYAQDGPDQARRDIADALAELDTSILEEPTSIDVDADRIEVEDLGRLTR